ncbi:hypothetical protein GALMADRAFT_67478 [Galerina marginata CBS 339.88]|uniref:Uncharacterized protein n=1 Tax=Galerina marginata (strain CBS 339.88) TaxID=685588 RepID=A0A067SYQ6_GALM3|nr:hypothetical protein GALMADRAFT_67478 [Galerina marginata CBS 339.88]
MYITNQSKYIRGQPGEFAAHHIAYIPKLGDKIHDWYFKTFGKVPTAAMLTHLRRELIQAIWLLLLDDEMMRAYEEGEAIKLFDDILRAMVLMSCIKFLGKWMCPRCLSLKEMVWLVGSKSDMRN